MFENGEQKVMLNGEDVSVEIRTPEASMAASDVSAVPEVRAFLFDLQRDIAVYSNIDNIVVHCLSPCFIGNRLRCAYAREPACRKSYLQVISARVSVGVNDLARKIKTRNEL